MANYKHLPRGEKHKFWQEHIDAWQTSGQSQTEYCMQQEIKESTFRYWQTKLSRKECFIEIPVKLESESTINIIIKDTVKLQVQKGFDPNLLIQVVKTLERLS